LRIIRGSIFALKISFDVGNTVIYSSSDFWPDSILALILKIRFRRVKWIAGFYLFAPNPFSKKSPYKGKLLIKGLLYYLSQIPIYWLIRKYADMVWVTNEVDRWKFIDNKRLTPDKVIAVRGGVDVKTPALIPEPKEKVFDAVFIGRFHPQKGVLELVDIWRYVCEKKKDAKLAMIGVGELENEIKIKIKKYGLENNIMLFGFKDGVEKLKIFKNSKIVVHPAIYDSGGMAACEAMACGLPGVSFDLPALKVYYPKGMLKTPCYDLKTFAENILKLLNDEKLYGRLQKEALEWAKEWDWDKRAEELLKAIKEL
jgi:glycosyltransferase involved in cell wall biosynthesis